MNNETIDYGVTRLSVVPVRAEANDRAEQVTQLLFGDHYHVLHTSKDKKWLRIAIHFDGYEGWLDATQHHSISKEYFEYINRADFKITTDITTSILYNKSPLIILMGSIIPISGAELFKMEEQFAFNGESKSLGQKRDAEFIRIIAQKYINTPYQWGGKSPFGIDCSGFVQMVFKIAGYALKRDAAQQVKQGRPVEKFADVQPGDVAFFTGKEKHITHTGIVLPDNKIIHASGKVRIDTLLEEGIVHTDTKIITHTLAHIRRIVAD